jgi:hypothetical protein
MDGAYFAMNLLYNMFKKASPVTGHGGPYGCEILRFPPFLDSQLTDGDEVVSFACQLPFTPRKILGSHTCYRPS